MACDGHEASGALSQTRLPKMKQAIMTYEEYSALVMDVSDCICYIADPVTYDLLYVNRKGQRLLGLPDGFPQDKCYRILQGKDSVCEFCTNALLSPGRFHTWEFYNPKLARHFFIRDTLIEHKDKKLRLEFCFDITDRKREEMKLKSRLSLEKTLVHCIYTLAGEKNIRHAMDSLFSIVGTYYNAQRVYLFEFNESKQTMDNTYEWCRAGAPGEIDKLQSVPLHYATPWIKRLEADGIIVINPLKGGHEWNFMECHDVEQQGVHSLMAVPLRAEKKIIGFLGVDNPAANLEDTRLLLSLPFFVQDHLEKRRLLSSLEDMSYIDKLTGLHNRNKYMAVLEALKNEPSSVGIIFADINGLKAVNDTYSHEFGDRLIKRAAEILQGLFSSDVFRIGGDEFVVLCRGMARQVFEEKIRELCRQREEEQGASLAVGSAWSGDGRDIARQLAEAEELMYQDKERYRLYRQGNGQRYSADKALSLQKDIRSGCFVVHLQPQISLLDGKLIGAEALVRRKDAAGNFIFPSRLIRFYEKHGIVRHLDLFVLETACAYLAKFKRKNCFLPISVNLSHMTLGEENFVENIKTLCITYDTAPSLLCLEVTEHIRKIGEKQLEELILRLRGEGFSISLSNFGSEYSSLSLAAGIDFSEIKLDKTLLRQITKFSNHRAMERLLNICRLMDQAKILAEGIESEEQKNLLIEHQCLYGQGYLFSRAIPIDDFLKMYDERNKSERIIADSQKD